MSRRLSLLQALVGSSQKMECGFGAALLDAVHRSTGSVSSGEDLLSTPRKRAFLCRTYGPDIPWRTSGICPWKQMPLDKLYTTCLPI